MRAFPEESRSDVAEIARNSREPRKKITEDFGIPPAMLSNWLKADEVENGTRDRGRKDQVEELRQLRRRTSLLEQENAMLRCAAAYLSQANLKWWFPEMMYPLVRELAVEGVPMKVTCRVLEMARHPLYRWLDIRYLIGRGCKHIN